MVKILKTKDEAVDKKKCEEMIAKLASDNIVREKSSKDTFPIPRVKDNCKYISLVYTLLNEHVKIGIPIHPAGEWILDNFYMIEKAAKIIEKELTLNKYINFPGLAEDGFARIFVLCNEIVSNTDGKIQEEDLKSYLEAYQTQKYLNMEEIWNIPIFLQICIIEKIRRICERIFIAQMEKYKVENMINRIIENKPGNAIKISVDGKYPFIEYMSYRLKRYGKKARPYLEAFEEQVNRMGITISDAINREHFDIAVRKLSIKNAIISIRDISRMNMIEIFKKINIVEQILNKDPADVYQKMDYSSKDYYRTKILEIAKKTKTSEIFIAEEVLKLSNKNAIIKEDDNKNQNQNRNRNQNKNLKKMHVGYYLIDDGKDILLSRLLNKKVKSISKDTKAKIYISLIYFLTTIITILLLRPTYFLSILLFIPIQNGVTKLTQYFLGKVLKQRILPKLDLQNNIPEELSTMCVLPVYLKSAEDVKETFRKMEVCFLANKSDNLFFTLLGDCSTSTRKDEEFDKEIIKAGIEESKKLNKKYGEIFFFTYRKREWVEGERCYMGWERKRGMLNQFNEFLITGNSKFGTNTIDIKTLPKIKYIITIDADTNLVMDSAFKLIGAMGHILNKPEIDKIKNIVVKGHAIIQPRVNLEIASGRKTLFTRLLAGNAGCDLYSSAIYDVYQDLFDEGIFTGKGIYDLDVFYEVLKDSIPENKVLSHDLLEGSFLRCGLANDIFLMDGYPSSYSAYKIRKHRWIRGDIQVLGWLNSGLNILSKYKILDNLVRNLNEVFIFFVLAIGMLSRSLVNIIIPLVLLSLPMIIDLVDLFINKKAGEGKIKSFTPSFSDVQKTVYKFILDVILLPDTANIEVNAIVKAFYRLKISHMNLLEWTTAKEAESTRKASLKEYYTSMIFSVVSGMIFINYPFSMLWIFSPLIMYLMSKKEERETGKLSKENERYLLSIGQKTWKYFKENQTNYLINDNYQENKRNQVAKRTSSTNIGLEILSIISSYDLGYESKEYVLELLENVIKTIEILPKWNGHLYNWYDTEKLTPLSPYVVSSVDSGNFVGYLYVLKQFLIQENGKAELVSKVEKLINETDFSSLYDEKVGLFSIGFNVAENKLYDSYYDLLASEARQTTLIAIAKKDVPSKSWSALGRTLTSIKGHIGLVSWGGTAFEYLMPNLIIPTYDSSLIDESCKLLILSQREYAYKLGIPWGISESAFSLKDFEGNYQYKTFGIPWLGLKRGLAGDIVVSPYSSALALTEKPKETIINFKKLEKEGALGKYGFYDAIDYSSQKEVIKIFMAHHEGMILSAINNQLNNNIFQKRFMKNPEMQGIKVLLQETMPNSLILTKEKKEKTKKIKYKSYEDYVSRNTGVNVISTNKYSSITYQDGYEFNKYGDDILTDENNIYIKDIASKKVWSLVNTKKETDFTAFSSNFKLDTGSLRAIIKSTIAPDLPVEIREISLNNRGLNDINLEITTIAKPILQNKKQYDSHPAFENMFIEFEYENDNLEVIRKVRDEKQKAPYLITTLFAEDGAMEYEIDKEKIVSRKNTKIPDAIYKSYPFSKKDGIVINPIIAMRRIINIKPNEIKKVYLIYSAEYDKDVAIKNLEEYKNIQNLERVFELSRVQTEAETRYLGIKGKDIETYQKMLKFLLMPEKINKNLDTNVNNLSLNVENNKIWKYGISGDFPIILVNIKDLNDYYVLEDIFRAYEFYRSKNIKVEVVINSKLNIEEDIRNSNMARYLNIREGIFVVRDITREDKKVLELRASIVIDAHNGSLQNQIKDLDDNIETVIYNDIFIDNKEVENNNSKSNLDDIVKFKNLKLFNGYGGFNEDGSEYWIIQNKDKMLPLAWSNILANKKFGSVVTDSMGGFIWYKNSRTNRITSFSNDSYMDKASEKFTLSLLKVDNKILSLKSGDNKRFTKLGDENKSSLGENKNKRIRKTWSLTLDESFEDYDYVTCFGLGYVKYFVNNEVKASVTQYVPINDSLKVSILKLKNNLNEDIILRIKYDLDLQIGESSEDKRYVLTAFKQGLNMNLSKNIKNDSGYVYVTSSEKINENNEIEIMLAKNEEKEVVFLVGCENSEMECLDKSTKYITSYKEEFENTKKYWREITNKVKVNTTCKSFDFLQNNWLVYQTIASRIFSRSGFYQASGGYGFRDQLQDCIGLKFVDINYLKDQILMCCRHQFFEGDVEHWWHEDSNLGIRTRYSDDLLFLPYAVAEYIDFTGDYSILNEEEMYIKAEELKDNEEDRVSIYNEYEEKGSVFEHCIKAIERASRFGKNGLPLMKSGDWNDGMNKVGEKEIGESVWLGFFLYDILNKFLPILNYMSKFEKKQIVSKDMAISFNDNNESKDANAQFIQDVNQINYDEIKEEFSNNLEMLKKALNTVSWDGRWYIRAFDDDGNAVGTINDEECKIDSIAQSWAVISNCGDNDKKFIAIESAENYLIDNENNLIKLLTPALDKKNLGYISSYAKGLRENGGQYTHAAIWLLMAEVLLGFEEKAFNIYKKINPIEHSLNKEAADKYKVEPFVVEADICSNDSLAGRGGWTWYTGSSSLLYKAQVEYILGIKIKEGKMTINPSVPKEWKRFEVRFKYFNAEYLIKYVKNGKNKTILDGKYVDEIILEKNKNHQITKYF